MKERFKKVKGFSQYFVSNGGRVFSLRYGRLKELTPYTVGGYKEVKLVGDDGNIRQLYVHRLVAQAFIANPGKLPEINHKDENKANNCVDNLEWCDRLHNMRHGTWVERARATRALNKRKESAKNANC